MEKFYTVEDIAKMSMFTTRTIRNYLKDGLLTGRKIGGQWRFTEDDINKFWKQGDIKDAISSEKRQDVIDFLDGVFTECTDEIQICSIIDVYRPLESIQMLTAKLLELTNNANTSGLRFSYEYIEKENKGRFTLFGTPEYISEAMKILTY